MKRFKKFIAAFLVLGMMMNGLTAINVAAATDEEKVYADYDWLTFDQIHGKNEAEDSITDFLNLPVKGKNGSRIFWSTSDSDVMLNSGVVIPDKSKTQEVTLTARIVSGDRDVEKDFDLTVLPGKADATPLHIVEVGDSNTEFGRITQNLNGVLKEEYGNYGDGFLTLAKDYIGWGNMKPANFSISYSGSWSQRDVGGNNSNYSPFGIHVEGTGAGASITVEFAGSAVDIYYLSTAQTGQFRVVIDDEDHGVVDTKNTSGQAEAKKSSI